MHSCELLRAPDWVSLLDIALLVVRTLDFNFIGRMRPWNLRLARDAVPWTIFEARDDATLVLQCRKTHKKRAAYGSRHTTDTRLYWQPTITVSARSGMRIPQRSSSDWESDMTALRMRKSSPARDDQSASASWVGKCPAECFTSAATAADLEWN